jgi:2-polyprenyl-6-methoxyphenol hydroxylase-like FAD-dependent oxidoreductase
MGEGSAVPELGQRAVVLGASMAGLLAARVLADFYRTVTVIERDVLPEGPVHRPGVPQGRHAHVLLARCPQILGELFPGLLNDLVADGVSVWSDGDLRRLWLSAGGHQVVRSGRLPKPDSMAIYFPSRPLLESSVRRRVRAIPNVTILDGHNVVGLTSTRDRGVTGARLVSRNSGGETTVTADLVVDATGRGSRSPAFLEELGYSRPSEDELAVRLAYASQLLRIPPGTVRESIIVVFPQPGRPTTFALVGYENDTWLLTLGGMVGHKPPNQRAEMLSFAAQFAPAHAVAALRAAEPLGEVAHCHVPSNRWRRYDKMRRTPEGLLVFGDAICSFNPIYGQGMTLAAVEAIVLRDCLRSGARDLPRRFFGATARNVRAAWQTAVGSDLALPEVVGPRPLSMQITVAYLERVLAAAESDVIVADQFLKVIGMIDSPARLSRPSIMFRVAVAMWRRQTDGRRADESSGLLSSDGC